MSILITSGGVVTLGGGVPRVVPAETLVAFVWDEVEGATSYVLQVGPSSGVWTNHNEDVGNVLTYSVALAAGTYISRVVPYDGATPLTPTAERQVTV